MKVDLWPVDGSMPRTRAPSKWRRFLESHLPSVVIYLMVATLVAVVLYPHMVVTVPSGEVGVLWKRFGGGTVLDPRKLKNEGFNLILPWNRVFLYDLRLQSFTESYNAISSDGVSLTATVIVRFRLQRDAVPVLHQAIGPNYVQVLALPGIGSLTREVIAQYTAEQVYSTARQEIQDKIRSLVEERLSEKMMEHAGEEGEESYHVSMSSVLILYDILVTGIELPAAIVTAINRKTEQYYIAEEYKFRVEREKRESERKKIEAEGIRDFQQTVSQGISDSYLRWRGIEATLQLSQSTNAKTASSATAKTVCRSSEVLHRRRLRGIQRTGTIRKGPRLRVRRAPLGRDELAIDARAAPAAPTGVHHVRSPTMPSTHDRCAQRIQLLGGSFHRSARIGCAMDIQRHKMVQHTLSANGTKRQFYACRRMSVLGGKAVVQPTSPQ
jgi:regulator of protease activity HflC (stomatin/prohibitin superfamily)